MCDRSDVLQTKRKWLGEEIYIKQLTVNKHREKRSSAGKSV